MLASKINDILEQEVEERTNGLKSQLKTTRDTLSKTREELYQVKQELKDIKINNVQSELVSVLQQTINEDNFEKIVPVFNLKESDFESNDRYGSSNDMAVYFKLTLKYYYDRDKLFSLMDMFGVKYPDWLKDFKIPQEYDEDQIDFLIKNVSKLSLPNGNYYSNNIRYFFETMRDLRGNVQKIDTFRSYIPWQFLLQNPLLTEERFFNQIIEVLKSKRQNAEHFYKIVNYQTLTDEQAQAMFETIPNKRLNREQEEFVSKNRVIVKNNPTIARHFKEQISDSSNSAFYFANYPLPMQMEHVRSKDPARHYEYVQKMNATGEEKMAFLMELAKDLFLGGESDA
jgi:hypothetical protein